MKTAGLWKRIVGYSVLALVMVPMVIEHVPVVLLQIAFGAIAFIAFGLIRRISEGGVSAQRMFSGIIEKLQAWLPWIAGGVWLFGGIIWIQFTLDLPPMDEWDAATSKCDELGEMFLFAWTIFTLFMIVKGYQFAEDKERTELLRKASHEAYLRGEGLSEIDIDSLD